MAVARIAEGDEPLGGGGGGGGFVRTGASEPVSEVVPVKAPATTGVAVGTEFIITETAEDFLGNLPQSDPNGGAGGNGNGGTSSAPGGGSSAPSGNGGGSLPVAAPTDTATDAPSGLGLLISLAAFVLLNA